MSLGASPPLHFLEQFEKDRNKFFFVILLEFPIKAIQSWTSAGSCFIIIITDSTSLLVINLFKLCIFLI